MSEAVHEVHYQLTRDDLVEASFFLYWSSSYYQKQQRSIRYSIVIIATFCLLLAIFERVTTTDHSGWPWSIILFAGLISFYFLSFTARRQQHKQIEKHVDAQQNMIALSPTTLRMDKQGIELENAYVFHRLKWVAVCQIRETPDYILLYLSQLSAEIIPKRAFDSPDAAAAFYQFAAQHCSTAAHCPRCRYDLRGNTSGVCPECGTQTRVPTARAAPPTQPQT
jgi:hypothetical protein